ncbi:hypothetical protein [Streptomyces luteolus]|uniref:Transposase n=1 Tax=Streptomyces luteolus TaxID=3043615 RepID=A0ABT6T7G1_9ACTN|nr:hypothetical protein [Streptomyces sp. B-S-A12]MDI3422802.1 hypothetical protein [Streptomyces sp. B-S-A12]
MGKTITRTTLHKRKPTDQCKDRRRGISDEGHVRLVTIGGNGASQARRAAAGQAYKRGPWQFRTWRREHDRMQCPNPRRHAELGDACVHQEITILEHPMGPEDAPFRPSNTVRQLKGSESE